PASSSSLTAVEVEGPRPVQIDVRVPADAVLWFDDSPTSQTGTSRRFVSPPLNPGKEYSYRIKGRWKENGQDVTSTREVAVHAGDQLHLTFGPKAVEAARR